MVLGFWIGTQNKIKVFGFITIKPIRHDIILSLKGMRWIWKNQ